MKKIILMFWACCMVCAARAQEPSVYFKFNESNGTTTAHEEVSNMNLPIANQFGKPERVTGVSGNALRTDGFSTWVQVDKNFQLDKSLTLETWVVLESYLSEKDEHYPGFTPSALMSQTDGNAGFGLFMNQYGRWYFRVNINGTKDSVIAPAPMPKYAWNHVVAVLDGPGGSMKIYLNGVQVNSKSTTVNGTINQANTPFFVGRSNQNKMDGIFVLNAMNATFDESRLFKVPLSAGAISSNYSGGLSTITTTPDQAIAVSPIRFVNDLQRPLFHAMPPANWTNEPHGLVYYNNNYHIFFQRTPNGPFGFLKTWGHLISPDFVNWSPARDSFWPQDVWPTGLGYDKKGCWSGDVVVNNGVAHAFYTIVNFSGADGYPAPTYDPGIGHATSSDANLTTWTKQGPVVNKQGVNDFRDPYIYKDGNTWMMIIGAAVDGSGGIDCYTSTDLNTWTHTPQPFSTVSYNTMDSGLKSTIWEMPVFASLGNGKYILEANPIGINMDVRVRSLYWIGTFANGRFTPDFTQPKRLDLIHGHLSPTITRNANNQITAMGIVDERRGSVSQLAAGWCHLFSLPRVWSLLADNQTLGQAPAPQLVSLRLGNTQQEVTNVNVSSTTKVNVSNGATFEIIATANAATTAKYYGLNLRVSADRNEITRLYYDAVNKKIVLDKTKSSLAGDVSEKEVFAEPYDEVAFGKPSTFHVYMDNSVMDVFINEKAAFSARIYPSKQDSRGVELYSEGGTTTFTSVKSWAIGTGNVLASGLALNKTSKTTYVGKTDSLAANFTPINTSNQKITWASSNNAIATVDANGIVTAVAQGTATITATSIDGNKSASCVYTVNPAITYTIYDFETNHNLTGWTVTPGGNAFFDGNVSTASTFWATNEPFNKQGTYHMWGFLAPTGDLAKGSMKTANFKLGGDGVISFLIGGGSNISNLYVSLNRVSDDSEIARTTASGPAESEAYTPRKFDASAYVGQNLYVKVMDNSDSGFGHINIDDLRIPTSFIPVTTVSLNKSTLTLIKSRTDTLKATIAPANSTVLGVTWSTNNAAVATVNANGVVTAVAPGTATITVTSVDGAKTATCTVTVSAINYAVYDFETNHDLTGWTVTPSVGSAFVPGNVATDNTFWVEQYPFNKQGTYHYWGFKTTGDGPKGSMKTANFTLGGDGVISFLIGGGNDIDHLYIALCRASDGVVLMKKTGANNEAYSAQTLNAAAYVGTECFVKVVDESDSGFGHINFDDLRIPIAGGEVTGVTLNKSSVTIITGAKETLVPTINPSQSVNKNVTWSSSNTAIATVNAAGEVTAVATGTATITVTTLDGAKTATCVVTVTNQPYLALDFETGDLTNWTSLGGLGFTNTQVSSDNTYWVEQYPFNKQGTYHFWGFKSVGDVPKGAMKSVTFTLSGNGQINYLIGGGNFPKVYLALVRAADDAILMRDGANNSETYTPKTFNAAAYVGTPCYMLAVDSVETGFGHINLDNIRIPVTAASPHNIMTAPLTVADQMIVNKPKTAPPMLASPAKVYPVPVDDTFTVGLGTMDETDAVMQITSLMGQTVLTQLVRAQTSYVFSARGLKMASNNIYFITIKGKHAYLPFKIIVK